MRWQPVLLYCAAVAVFVAAALWGAPMLRLKNLPGTQPSIEVLGSGAAGGDPQAGEDYWAVAQNAAAGDVHVRAAAGHEVIALGPGFPH